LSKIHSYRLTTVWTGNNGSGTSEYKAYSRSHSLMIEGKPEIKLSSDPSFLGDKSLHNPEELFLASLSGCQMLWYLHLCSVNKITVTEYSDYAEGEMTENDDGTGCFESVTLKPKIIIKEAGKKKLAMELHSEANKYCFIANSSNFKVLHQPEFRSI
jgi:organic hydroperoxide reductase OsmC/OhrA